MRKLWTVVAALLSGAALILFAPNASAAVDPVPAPPAEVVQPESPVDFDVEIELLSENEELVGLPG
ncbi:MULTISPECIES: hypothetical protein [unclassified Crossiella]|uniref:hypothetical protein n=1 Tax=unclassified Crossiella TaxID=2620835 RepID=UPI001FFEDDB6|nr:MULTISPECIES: hypothetical protein [unclassified Crossiella]MCK2243069.1 hypothetical protein [Crossiella sp. S99.2]MCK2256946.1 hypothetical protein [Crossiella sp. S99.1]